MSFQIELLGTKSRKINICYQMIEISMKSGSEIIKKAIVKTDRQQISYNGINIDRLKSNKRSSQREIRNYNLRVSSVNDKIYTIYVVAVIKVGMGKCAHCKYLRYGEGRVQLSKTRAPQWRISFDTSKFGIRYWKIMFCFIICIFSQICEK